MRVLSSMLLGTSFACLLGAFATVGSGCNAKVENVLGNADASSSNDSGNGPTGPTGLTDEDRPLVPASKVDVLLVVDNSASMSDKSSRLSASIGTLLRDVAQVGDVHVGVISTSLGNFGGDVCMASNPATNEHAYLHTTGPDGSTVLGAESGVLSFTGGDVDAFVANAQALINGVGQVGCGLEAQLESMYRFLIQPDPWETVKLNDSNQAVLTAIDVKVLQQRKAFLRPDSALVVVMLTDEDDSAVDPLSIGGQGWAFMAKNFPGSKVFRGGQNQGTTAPRGTSVCATDPGNADCTSCGYQSLCDQSDPACQKIKNDPACQTSGQPGQGGDGYNGYYGPSDDELNVRFHRMKERYGIDPQYPISRYVDGLTRSVVPDRSREHQTSTTASHFTDIAAYTGTPDCTNPIFAASLPSEPSDEICSLARGPRSRELVLFAVLGGLPPALATDTPDWTKILGQDPDNYNYTGIEPHMIQSVAPRVGLPAPTSGAADREWDTQKGDLQYACTFALAQPRVCNPDDTSCECSAALGHVQSPICEGNQQTRAKAYPTPRPLRVVRELGQRGVVGSVCADTYDGALAILNQRLASRLAK